MCAYTRPTLSNCNYVTCCFSTVLKRIIQRDLVHAKVHQLFVDFLKKLLNLMTMLVIPLPLSSVIHFCNLSYIYFVPNQPAVLCCSPLHCLHVTISLTEVPLHTCVTAKPLLLLDP